MNIVCVVSGSPRSNFTYRMLRLATELRQRGHNLTLIAPRADKYNQFKPEQLRDINGVRIVQPYQFVTTNALLNLVPYLVSASLAVLRQRADVVFIYKPTPVSVVGLLARLRPGTKVVLDMDDLGSEVMRLEGRSALEYRLVAWSELLAERLAHGITAASSFLVNEYRQRYPAKPVLRLPNAADPGWLEENLAVPARPRPHIVFLGALDRQSIIEPLMHAFPKVAQARPDAHLTIIGDGPYLDFCREHVRKHGVAKQVTFAGWLELTEARQLMQPGDIGYAYMPNERTVLAASIMKVPQYMAWGVVPVVSDIGDLPDAIGHGKGGYISKHSNAEALADTLVHAMNDPGRTVKVTAGQALVRESLNWRQLAAQTDAWLTELARA